MAAWRHGKYALTLTGLLICGAAWAHSGATGIVKQRMDVMADIGENMKTIGAMIKGKAAFDGASVAASATTIAGHAGRIPHLFPEGTTKKPSEAIPAIWTDWPKFTTIAAELETKSQSLAKVAGAASTVGEIRKEFLAVAGTCKACHSDFRLKK